MWQWGFLSIGVGAVIGIDPLISQAHGRGDAARRCAGVPARLIVVALAVSVPVCACCWRDRHRLALARPAARDRRRSRSSYNLLKLPTVPCFLVYTALRQYLQGRGMMAPATWAAISRPRSTACSTGALIFGHFGLPALGMRGAAHRQPR